MTSAIRIARPDDATAIAELLGELGYPTDAKRFKRRLERIEQDPSSRLFVATRTELVLVIEREARSRGGQRVLVHSANHRADAHAFYERLGFEATGLRFVKAL